MDNHFHFDLPLFFQVSLLFIILGLVVFMARHTWRQIKHRRWRERLNLTQHQTVFEHIYGHVDAFDCSLNARKKKDDLSYVYGEIDFESFIACLSLTRPKPHECFLDLGSGSGKAVIAAAMVFNLNSFGIELFNELNQLAEEAKSTLVTMSSYLDLAEKVHFINADFLTMPWPDAHIVFINATAFFGDMWKQICMKIDELSHCRMIITTTRPLQNPNWVLVGQSQSAMSWGVVDVYFQQKLDTFD